MIPILVRKFPLRVANLLPSPAPAGLGAAICRGALALLVTITFSGCSILGMSAMALSDPDSNAHTAWAREDVAGHTLTLLDPNRVGSFQFSDGGVATANIGKGNMDPDYRWRIVKGDLQIFDHKALYEDLTLVTINGGYLLATRKDGKLAKYRYE